MNSFGRIFRLHVYGESHGNAVGVLLDGLPPGISILESDFYEDLARRKPGRPGTTERIEDDAPELVSGVFNNKTTGAPLLLNFKNNNTRSEDYLATAGMPRPGHADLTASRKFDGFNDYRGGGHFSGRLTLALVAAGVLAKKVLPHIRFQSRLIEAGGLKDIEKAIEMAKIAGDSIGGVVECTVDGVPVGFGEPFFDSVESVIAHLAFSIPAVKAVEFGSGLSSASMFGSEHNDAIISPEGLTATNHSGGISGGITNGNPLVVRLAVKPTSSTPKEQESLNLKTGRVEKFNIQGRHDLCIALRVPVVLEAIVAIALADFYLLESSSGNYIGKT